MMKWYFRGVTPYPPHATKALRAWLNLRFEPEKAKIFYLTHHLGLSDAIRFIKKTITEERAHKLLVAQVGAKKAAKSAKDNGSYVEGHRTWLSEYIDKQIELKDFYCPKIEFTIKQNSGSLENVIEKINGGEK